MARRMKRNKDIAVYKRTAVKTKKINRCNSQGGVRF